MRRAWAMAGDDDSLEGVSDPFFLVDVRYKKIKKEAYDE
jgi:hypothetical protein